MKKGKIISALIALAFVVVAYFFFTESIAGNPHGPNKEEWIYKKHKETIIRNGNPEKFCIDCHAKKGQTKEKFCNSCHEKNGLKIDIEKYQKRG